MRTKNYYKILGIAAKADDDEIRKAYLKLAKRYHPDHNPGDERALKRFKEVKEAYEVLSDATARRRYDNVRRMHRFGFDLGDLGSSFRRSPNSAGDAGFDLGDLKFDDVKKAFKEQFGKAKEGLGSVSDLFDSFFKKGTDEGAAPASGGGNAEAARGEDVELSVHVSRAMARDGGKLSVTVPVDEGCTACDGRGGETGASRRPCKACGGSGRVDQAEGGFALSRPCPECLGRGERFEKPCGVCEGTGTVEKTRRLRVSIPAGIVDGKEIRLAGQGQAGPAGGRAGDLRILVHVRGGDEDGEGADAGSGEGSGRREGEGKREGKKEEERGSGAFGSAAEEELTVLLNLAQAVLGTRVTVSTPEGKKLKVRIPAGVEPGMCMRLRGKGSEGGDLRLRVLVDLPDGLSASARKKFESFAREAGLAW